MQHQSENTETKYFNEVKQLKEEMENKSKEFERVLETKDLEIKDVTQKLENLEIHIHKLKCSHEEEVNNKQNEISNLQAKFKEMVLSKSSDEENFKTLIEERDFITMQLEQLNKAKGDVNDILSQKLSEITSLQNKLEEIENSKRNKILELQEESNLKLEELNRNINNVQVQLKDQTNLNDELRAETEVLVHKINIFEKSIENRDKQIEQLSLDLNKATSLCEKQNAECELLQKEAEYAKITLNETLQNVTTTKDVIINDLKSMIAEKDDQVITLTIEVGKLNENIRSLNEVITETQAELEITKDELLNIREEYQFSINKNQENIDMKNIELRSLREKVDELTKSNSELVAERGQIIDECKIEKQVCGVLYKTYYIL